jgi:transcriptional regulator with XRE-family HTH domain
MTRPSEISQLAAFLSMLKDRSGRSYAALARRTGMSASSLHRYCTGEKLPPSYARVRGFADTCGRDAAGAA